MFDFFQTTLLINIHICVYHMVYSVYMRDVLDSNTILPTKNYHNIIHGYNTGG